MADQHTYDVTIGEHAYTVNSDSPLSDVDAYKYAKMQADADTKPAFDVKAQNATMRANMAKQPPGTGERSTLEDFATSGPMGNFNEAMGAAGRGEGAKAVHQAVVGTSKVLAPAALPLLAASPAAAVVGLAGGAVGDIVGRKAASLVTDNPDYKDVAGDAGGVIGAGGSSAALRFARPYAMRALGAVADSVNPDIVGLVSPRAGNAVRVAQKLHNALAEKPVSVAKTAPADVAQMMRERLSGTAGQDAEVPVPDRGNVPRAEPQGTGMERTIDQPLYKQQQALENGEVLTGHKAVEPVAHPTRPAPPVPKATGVESLTKAPAFKEPAPVAKFGFEWPEVGDQYELLQDIPGHKKGSHVSAETLQQAGVPVPAKPIGHTEPSLEVVDSGNGPNASGESTASREALSRQSAMQARGEEFVVKKGNTMRKLVGPDAVDYTPQAGETFGVRDKAGNFRPLSDGETKQALTASHGKGVMPIAMRRALYNAMMKRSGQ